MEKQKAEEEKKYKPRELSTGMSLILTEFYVTECLKSEEPQDITRDFLERYMKL